MSDHRGRPGVSVRAKVALRLAGAFVCLLLLAAVIYSDRGDPIWGLIGTGSFILSALLRLWEAAP
jgi:hypothetical protein